MKETCEKDTEAISERLQLTNSETISVFKKEKKNDSNILQPTE